MSPNRALGVGVLAVSCVKLVVPVISTMLVLFVCHFGTDRFQF